MACVRAVLWAGVLVTACGDNTVDVDGAHSGSRLKIRWFELDDGVRQSEAHPGTIVRDGQVVNAEVFYDEQLDVTCAPELWADGVIRCTPIASDDQIFGDAACTLRVSRMSETLAFGADREWRCNRLETSRVYPVVGRMLVDAVYVRGADGACNSYGSGFSEVAVLGDPVSPTQYAVIDTTTSHDEERVQVRYHESSDGMRLPIGLADELLGPALLSDGYAIPEIQGGNWYWTDETCSGETVVRVEAGCSAPPSAYTWPDDQGRYSRVAELTSVSTVYQNGPGGCTAQPTEDADYYRIVDERLPLADMVTTPDDSGSRVQVVGASTGARLARTGLLFDTEFGDCELYEVSDGEYRCGPVANGAYLHRGLFSDAACQVSIELASRGYLPNGYRPSTLVLDDHGGADNSEVRVVTDRYQGPIYTLEQDGCRPLEGFAMWRVGRVVDWSELVRADLVSD